MYKSCIEYDRAHGRYRVRKVVGGRVRKGTFPTRRAAVLFLEQLSLEQHGILLGQGAASVAEGIDSYLRECRLAGRSPLTISYYEIRRKALESGFGQTPLYLISQAGMDAYVEARSNEVSTNTVAKEIAFLRSVYKHLGIAPLWRSRVLTERPSRRRVYPVELVRNLVSAASEPVFCAVGLCLFAGMRAAEAWRAEAGWVRDDLIEIQVLKAGGDVNVTYLVPALRERLPRAGPLVTANEAAVRYELEKLSKKVGISPPVLGPGIFRHHCATYAAELGFTREDRKLVLGHRFGDVTDRYVHSQEIGRKRKVLEAVAGYVLGTPPDAT